ncbi:excalibur calcium-binding domain-containing protein [Rhodococcus sp. O3]|uniref:excalibur calcium-binding domain-containing protein n=1 Tax=Rhodococcus sp. O3 TaxID=3404919 RepID=UPI003B6751D8
MTAQLTPKEAKAIAERHLKSLGFTLDTRAGSGRMQIRARGVVAQVTVRATPVSRSELAKMYENRGPGSRDAMAYFALNGYGKTAVDYATAKGIQLYGFDSSGRVAERNHVGLRGPGAVSTTRTASTTNAAPTISSAMLKPFASTSSGASSGVSFTKPVSPSPRTPAAASAGSRPPSVTAVNASPGTSAGRRTKRWMAGVGVALFSVVAGSLIIGTSGSDSGSDMEPVRVVSTTVRSAVPATTSAPRRDLTQPLSGGQPSSVSTTAPTYTPPPPPPVYTPAYTPPPVYTPSPEYTPAPAPQSSPYYKNCAAARAAGAAPLYIGEAGYRSKLDADGDGVACEWS